MGHVKIWRLDKGTKSIFFVESPVECTICGEEIDAITHSYAIHVLDWGKKGLVESIMHENCMKNKFKRQILSVVPERKIVLICQERPIGCVLVVPSPTNITARNRSEMSTAYMSLAERPSVRTTDRTVHSFKDSFEGALIGSSDAVSLCEEKDAGIGRLDKGLDLLDTLMVESKEEYQK